MHQLEKEGSRSAKLVNRLQGERERVIGALLMGNTFINILASSLATYVFEASYGPRAVAVATAFMTVLVLIFAEVLPKTLAIGRPDEIARLLSAPILIVVRIFGPMIGAIQWVIREGLRLFGFDISPPADAGAAQEEIRGAVEYHHSEGLVDNRDRRMLGGVLDLADMDVSEVMIHRKALGEIEDDHDAQMEGVRRQPDGSVNVDGTVTIRELNRAMDWQLPDYDAVTIAGLVIHEAQTIPDPGQTFIFHGHRFQVLRRQRNQITAVRVSPRLEAQAGA